MNWATMRTLILAPFLWRVCFLYLLTAYRRSYDGAGDWAKRRAAAATLPFAS
jgi:hypothetical protein